MKKISLLDIQTLIPSKTWQTYAIYFKEKPLIYSKISIQDLYNIAGFDADFFKVLNENIYGEPLTRQLDKIAIEALEKARFTHTPHVDNVVLEDVIEHLKSARKSSFVKHTPVKVVGYGTTHHNGGHTPDVIKYILDCLIICEQGCGCFIPNGENYILYHLMHAVLTKDWSMFFTSPAFTKNPEKTLKKLDTGRRNYTHPTYTEEKTFTKPLLSPYKLKQKLFEALQFS